MLNTTCAAKMASGNLTDMWTCPFSNAFSTGGELAFTGDQMLWFLIYSTTVSLIYMKTKNMALTASVAILLFAEFAAYNINMIAPQFHNAIALIVVLLLALVTLLFMTRR